MRALLKKYLILFIDDLFFKDKTSYKDKFKEAQRKTEMQDAFLIGFGKIQGITTTVIGMNFIVLVDEHLQQ